MSTRTFTFPVQAPAAATWLNGKSTFEWVALDNLGARTEIHPTDQQGANGIKSVVISYSGGTLRPAESWYLIQGGGHGDYSGNQIYGLKLSDNTPTWQRVWGPTPYAQVVAGATHNADGNPSTCHTYYYLQYDTVNDQILRVGGGRWVSESFSNEVDAFPWTSKGLYGNAGTTGGWKVANTYPDSVASYPAASVCRNATTGEVYVWNDRLRSRWTPGLPTFTTVGNTDPRAYEGASVHDPVRNCVWVIGGYGSTSSSVRKWDLSTNVASTVAVTGAAASVLGVDSPRGCGACYDLVNNVVWFYLSTGVVYKFDPAELTVTQQSMAGTGPLADAVYGFDSRAWSRWQYVPELKGVVFAPVWKAPTFYFRTSL